VLKWPVEISNHKNEIREDVKIMKRIRAVLVLGAVVLLPLFSGLALAYDDAQEGQEDQKGNKGEWMEKFYDKLELSQNQKDKISAIMKDSKDQRETLRKEMGTLLKELRDLVKNKASEDKLTEKLNALQQNKDAMQTLEKNLMEKKKTILTPLQQAKAVLGMSIMKTKHKSGKNRQGKS
jgi:Spy/CpxP family protein refolding chaperone